MFNPKRYAFELGCALLLYMVTLAVSILLYPLCKPWGFLAYCVCLLPMVGGIAMAWVILRAFQLLDELQRRIQFDAIALAFLGTALITLSWGFAENAGLPPLRSLMIWPIMGALWGLGTWIALRRYR